jgi:4-oxalocrotonate tautomerase
MPFVNIKISKPLDKTLKSEITKGFVDLLQNILHKNRAVTSVLIEDMDNSWFIETESQDKVINLFARISITKNTNTQSEKEIFQNSLFTLLKEKLGALPLATYIIIEEIEAINWGYSGITQKNRTQITL